uniref:Uncharacterized protein n=1 Tax=Anguilla anguilla TaxID=7936 RepID=A0A0E9U7V6_ANGAN
MGGSVRLNIFPRCCKPAVETVVLFWLCRKTGGGGLTRGPCSSFTVPTVDINGLVDALRCVQ